MDGSALARMLSPAIGSASGAQRATGYYCGDDPAPTSGAGLATSWCNGFADRSAPFSQLWKAEAAGAVIAAAAQEADQDNEARLDL